MIKTNYTVSELNLPKNLLKMPVEYQKKTKSQLEAKFVNILSRIKKNIYEISFHEKEFAYNFNLSNRIILLKKYNCFFDFYFLEIYSKYRINQDVTIELSDNKIEQILSKLDAISLLDLKYFYNEWNEKIIENEKNHGNSNLKSYIKGETKDQLKLYIKEQKTNNNHPTFTDDILNSDYCKLVLHSKWVYLISEKIIDTYETKLNYYMLKLNNSEIRFTIKSLVHILIRHYSPLSKIAKKYKNEEECSNHNENVPFEKIHLQLENIFNEIDNSKILKDIDLFKNLESERKKLDFKFKGQKYRVWFFLNPNKNEKGNLVFKEIDTFYPLTKQTDIDELSKKIKKINNDLYLYIENE